jgi:hypothetical protein
MAFGGGPLWRPITKRSLDLFGRWGDPRTNLKSMLDTVLPVVVVDRFRGDDEGSIFGIRAVTGPIVNEYPSVNFGSAVNDWELLGVSAVGVFYTGAVGSKFFDIHLFTPIAPYNPAVNLDPVGFFRSGLLNNRAFTFGTVSAIAGSNPGLPLIRGPSIQGPWSTTISTWVSFFEGFGNLSNQTTPMRIYADTTLSFQYAGSLTGLPIYLDVSILYRERPKVSV